MHTGKEDFMSDLPDFRTQFCACKNVIVDRCLTIKRLPCRIHRNQPLRSESSKDASLIVSALPVPAIKKFGNVN